MPYRKQHSNAPPAAQLPCKKAKQAHNCIHVRSFLTIFYCFTHHIRQLLRLLNRQPWLFHPARRSSPPPGTLSLLPGAPALPPGPRPVPPARAPSARPRPAPPARAPPPRPAPLPPGRAASARHSFPSARPRRIRRGSAYFLPDGGHKKSPGVGNCKHGMRFFAVAHCCRPGYKKRKRHAVPRRLLPLAFKKTAPILPTGRTEARSMEQRCSGGRAALRAHDDSGPRQSGSATRTAQPS